MKMNKGIIVALGLVLSLGVVACTNNDENLNDPGEKNPQVSGQGVYTKQYEDLYGNYITSLDQYTIYDNDESALKAYQDEYPGNEKYVEDVKMAYKDSREKIQSFVDGLKNDVDAEDADIKKMNEDLIVKGENLIKEIDGKIEKLDQIPEEDYTKGKEDFIRGVNDTIQTEGEVKNDFTKMLNDMKEKLGLN